MRSLPTQVPAEPAGLPAFGFTNQGQAEGRGNEGQIRRPLLRAPRYGGQAAGLQSWSLNPTHSFPGGTRWAQPAAVIEPLRSSRPSVYGFRI
jgi:hypothetical protein